MKAILTFLLMMSVMFAQSQTSSFRSSKYGYTINKPSGFETKAATGKHIDFKVASADGGSILVNVSSRLPEEKGIDAHSYSKQYFEQVFEYTNSNNTIEKTEKTYIDGRKAFIIYYSYPHSSGNRLKVIEAYFFAGDNAYVITTTADEQHFNGHKNSFLAAIKSFKLAKS